MAKKPDPTISQIKEKLDHLKKMAMAGHGALGAPGSMTGGAALGAESIDGAKRFTKAGPKKDQSYAQKKDLEKISSPKRGHTIAQLERLKEDGYHNPDTGTELQPDEADEHLNRLRQNKADRKNKTQLKSVKPTKSDSPEDWSGIIKNDPISDAADTIVQAKKISKKIHQHLKDGHKPELEKGVVKDMAVGAAMAAGAALGSTQAMAPVPAGTVSALHHHVQLHDELKHIAQIESSSGKNKNHVREVAGMHSGHQAAGETGLMPITIQETLKKNPDLNKKYGFLLNKKPDEVTAHLNNNKETEYEIANAHWDRLGKHFGDDTAKKAFAWRNGITAAKQATPEQIADHPYVRTYKHLAEMKKSDLSDVRSKLNQLKDKLK